MEDDFKFNPARPRQRGNYLLTNFVTNYDDLGRASVEHMIKYVDKHDIDLLDKSESRGIIKKIAMYLNLSNPIEWIFLFFFAIVITIFFIPLDKLTAFAMDKRRLLASTDSHTFNFIFWVSSSVLFFLLAASPGYFISPDSDGSGIPEMKTVLSGINIYRYFSFNAFIGKTLSVFAIQVGGASIGKGGPYVHIACMICNRLMKIKYFSQINKSSSSKNNMMAAAIAAAITLALGTPLGAVLFSIETTASIYIVSNIWKSFFCAVICIFVSKIMQNSQTILLADITESKAISFNSEVILFMILGVLGGIIGATISTLVAKIVYIRRRSKSPFLSNRFRYAALVAVIVSVTTFTFGILKKSDRGIMNIVFAMNPAKLKTEEGSWNEGLYLFLVFASKLIITVFSLTVNCAAGVFGPVFAAGALFGRFYGHVLNSIFTIADPSIYSLVGAACVLSGATHTLTAALIIFEMTGQTSYLTPLLLATLIANLTGQSLSMNVFDVIRVIRNLPHLPMIKSETMYNLNSNDIMNKLNFYMEMDKLTVINAMNILVKLPKKYTFVIPLVDETGTIRFTLQVKSLYKYIYAEFEKVKLSYNIKNQSNFNEFFNFIRRKFFSIKRSFFQQIQYKFRKLYISLRDKQRLKLNKNFEEESNGRLLTIFKDNAADDTVYLNKVFDLEDKLLAADKSALTVDKNFPVLKVQFLFTFLNVSHLFVTDNGQLAGIITKEEFIKKSMAME